jgi:hypothetical protein
MNGVRDDFIQGLEKEGNTCLFSLEDIFDGFNIFGINFVRE